MYYNNIIYAYYTHYEIVNYDMGDCPLLEKMFSIYDNVYHKLTYYCYYDKEKKILYLPRGLDNNKLYDLTGKPIMNYVGEASRFDKVSFSMKLTPRDDVQKESIRYLLGKNEYAHTAGAPQLILALIGGGGKTYCATAAMNILGYKTMVICHTEDLIKQWIDRFAQYTNIPSGSIVKLSSQKELESYLNPDRDTSRMLKNVTVFITTHSLMHNFITKRGFDDTDKLFSNMGIGLKIIDEFHRNFMNTLLIDYATNVKKTFYLSATPGRTDFLEDQIFQASFSRVYKFKRDSSDFGRESDTICIYDLFSTVASHFDLESMIVAKKFNIHRYTDYEMEKGVILDRILFWLHWLFDGNRVTDGTVYVLSSKKESCDIIYNIITKEFPDKKTCVHYTGSKVDNVEDFNIVCGTVRMFGTGNDIEKLQAMIVAEPVGSEVNADQLIHRLMRGKNIGTTYNIDLVDKSVPNVYKMYRRRKRVYAKFAKKNIDFKS